MALHIGNSSCSTPAQLLSIRSPRHDSDPRCPTSQSRLAVRNAFDSHVARAKRASSRTGRLESRNRKGGLTATPQEEDQVKKMRPLPEDGGGGDSFAAADNDDGYFLPELPGDKPDFWEGPQWNAFGFFIQYQWAFGIGFALIACGIAVATYNEGATDFKQTTVYKESIQSRELLDQPEASNSDVFEGNPTEEAPSLE